MTTRALLFDFDGPVCDFFAGFPAPDVAKRLRASLGRHAPGDWMPECSDPHEILRSSITLGPDVAYRANRELTALESEAVKSAEPTPHAAEAIRAARSRGEKVAIVSNNAASAITQYLSAHGLTADIDYVSARTSPDTTLMKPSPFLVTEALRALQARPLNAMLIGDQLSDVTAAHRAGVKAVGYANKAGKADEFRSASSDMIITSMSELLADPWRPASGGTREDSGRAMVLAWFRKVWRVPRERPSA
jgi:HAD superfamily hydrolase (TIGR01509 family)